MQYLESELRQKDSQLRSFERQVEHAKADARNLEKEVELLRYYFILLKMFLDEQFT